MKVKTIIPCVCIDHIPNAGDSSTYGMPAMKMVQSTFRYKQYFIPYCPNCGRTGLHEFESSYYAMKHWNKIMTSLWKTDENQKRLREMAVKHLQYMEQLNSDIGMSGNEINNSDPMYMYDPLEMFEDCWKEK